MIALHLAACLLVADFITGVGHWLEDTWAAPGRWSALNRLIVEPNIDHHRRPGAMNANAYWETNRVTIALAATVALVLVALHVSAWEPYVVLALVGNSNQVHAWAHTRRVPRAVALLQRVGLLQSMRHHGLHHRRPYASRFCTMTDFLNPLLDGTRFWRALELGGERLGLRVARGTAARGGF